VTTMDPLSVTASITGIITAATQVSTILGQIKDAPIVLSILTEVDHIKLVFRVLQNFLDGASASIVTWGRAALIQLEDLVMILTQTVLVFSGLETLIYPYLKPRPNRTPAPYLSRPTCTTEFLDPGFRGLVSQLRSHKKPLTLLLQIIQW
jgi:hypothetical protein